MENFITINSFEAKFIIVIVLFLSSIVFLLLGLKKWKVMFAGRVSIFWLIGIIFLVTAILVGRPLFLELKKSPKLLGYSQVDGLTINPQFPDINLTFTSPIKVNDLKVYSYPEMDFNVVSENVFGKFPWATKITISPKETLPSGEHFIFYLSDINSPLNQENGEEMIEVTTRSVDVVDVDPKEGSVVTADQTFKVKLTEAISNVDEWSVMTEPVEIFKVKQTGSHTLEFTPREPLRQGHKYRLTLVHTPIISDRKTGNELYRSGTKIKSAIRVTTASAANVKSLEPQDGGVNPDADITITFQEPMNIDSVEKNISVSPSFTYGTKWDVTNTKITLVNKPLVKDTEYTITLGKGAQTAKGGSFESEISYHFHTAGPLKLVSSSPENNGLNILQKSSISMVFDQNISDKISDSITITPNTPGKISISEKTFQFIPDSPLLSDTRYIVSVALGTSGIYGLPSLQEQTISFSTIPNITVIDVPYFRQNSLFSCNISAARMLLAYRGILMTEQQLIDVIGTSGPRGEGNPYKGYINNYGTYWEAVSKGVASIRPIRMITSGKLSDIIAELKKGNPVMTWGQNGWSTPRDISWTSTDGTFIHAINGMHSTVVRGYSGPDNNPTQIYLNDPWRGQYSISTSEFMRRWNYFLMAMVVD